MKKQSVVVSSCLLGELCRYDGQTKTDSNVVDFLEGKTIIPFCPEAPIFGTPRPRINVVGERIVREDGEDVTAQLQAEIDRQATLFGDVDLIILKSKSPSCGLGTTPVLDEHGNEVAKGDGLAAKSFKQKYRVVDELAIMASKKE